MVGVWVKNLRKMVRVLDASFDDFVSMIRNIVPSRSLLEGGEERVADLQLATQQVNPHCTHFRTVAFDNQCGNLLLINVSF